MMVHDLNTTGILVLTGLGSAIGASSLRVLHWLFKKGQEEESSDTRGYEYAIIAFHIGAAIVDFSIYITHILYIGETSSRYTTTVERYRIEGLYITDIHPLGYTSLVSSGTVFGIFMMWFLLSLLPEQWHSFNKREKAFFAFGILIFSVTITFVLYDFFTGSI